MNEFKSGVYQIVNKISGRVYIGSSKDIPYRFKCHRRELLKNVHGNIKLQRSWNTHGESSFDFQILLYCSETDRIFYEQRFIDKYNSVEEGYNIVAIAGSPFDATGIKRSPETVIKMSVSAKNRSPVSDITKATISEKLKGRKLSKSHIVNRSKSQKGVKRKPRTEAEKLLTKELRRKIRQEKLLKEKEIPNEQRRSDQHLRKPG